MNIIITEIDRLNLINDYKNDIPVSIISKKYNISKSRIYQILLEDNIEKRTKIIITDDIIKLAIDEYNNTKVNMKKISSKYKISYYKLVKIFDKFGVKYRKGDKRRSKYQLNINYFDLLDSNEKFWILGWLFTDGYNMEYCGAINLTVSTSDSGVLKQILSLMGGNQPIQSYGNKKCSRVVVISRHLSEQLYHLGMVQKKSLILKYPNYITSLEQTCCFLRGVIEGDGSIVLSNGILSISVECWSPDFLNGIKENIEKYWPYLSCSFYVIPGKSSQIRINGGEVNKIKFLDDIYNLNYCKYYLNRKYNHYLEIKKFIEEKERIKNQRVLEYKEKMSKIPKTSKSWEFYIKKENIIYLVSGIKRFCYLNRVSRKDITMLLKNQKIRHKLWTLPTGEEIKNAESKNEINKEFL